MSKLVIFGVILIILLLQQKQWKCHWWDNVVDSLVRIMIKAVDMQHREWLNLNNLIWHLHSSVLIISSIIISKPLNLLYGFISWILVFPIVIGFSYDKECLPSFFYYGFTVLEIQQQVRKIVLVLNINTIIIVNHFSP